MPLPRSQGRWEMGKKRKRKRDTQHRRVIQSPKPKAQRPNCEQRTESWKCPNRTREVEKGVYHVRLSSSITRGQRNWKTGDPFTVADATDLYEVERWGKGYFSISSAGHVLVHPT